jgi:hypothetical protein
MEHFVIKLTNTKDGHPTPSNNMEYMKELMSRLSTMSHAIIPATWEVEIGRVTVQG